MHWFYSSLVPLDKPEEFMNQLTKMKHFKERLECWLFQDKFSEIICGIGIIICLSCTYSIRLALFISDNKSFLKTCRKSIIEYSTSEDTDRTSMFLLKVQYQLCQYLLPVEGPSLETSKFCLYRLGRERSYD